MCVLFFFSESMSYFRLCMLLTHKCFAQRYFQYFPQFVVDLIWPTQFFVQMYSIWFLSILLFGNGAGCQWYPRVIPLLCFCSFAPSSRRFICTSWKLRWFQMLPPPRSCRMCHHQVTSSYAHKKCCDCDAFEIQCKRASPTAILWKERSVICSISFVC